MTSSEIIRWLIAPIIVFSLWVLFNRRAQIIWFVCAAFIFLLNMVTLYEFDYPLDEYFVYKLKFCSRESNSFSCFFSTTFENKRVNDVNYPKDVCNACFVPPKIIVRERIKYVTMKESSLSHNDMIKIQSYLHTKISDTRYAIGEIVGIKDFLEIKAEISNIQNGVTTKSYSSPIRGDGFFPELVNFKSGCVRNQQIILSTINGEISAIEWIGDVEKTCFDMIWQPALGRFANYSSDEQFRPFRIIDTIVRYEDRDINRIIFVSSRSPFPQRNRVGVRLSFICTTNVPQPIKYEETAYKPFFMATENIAMQ